MPSSAITFDNVFQLICQILKPRTVFDFGAGAGKYGRLIKLLNETHKTLIENTTAVEIDEEYIKNFSLESIYSKVLQTDLKAVVGEEAINGDLAILGDVLEHLPKSKGVDICEFLMYKFKHIYIVTPIDMIQDSWHGKTQEMHISRWFEVDFQNYPDTSCIRLDGMLLVVINGIPCQQEEKIKIELNGNNIQITLPYRVSVLTPRM